jgi:cell division protein FtsL
MATIAVSNVRRTYGVTPEIYFYKPIDNSRLVKVTDPERKREMAMFASALGLLLVLFLVFCWQHYSAIEYGYRNEALRQQREQLLEARRQLQLDEAQLREPWRIDELAHQMGLQAPMAGQVVRLDTAEPNSGGPVMARVAAVSVISATQ